MANPAKTNSLMADGAGNPLFSDQQANVADTAALTSDADAVTITYSANDPSITPDAAITIADGSTPTVAELLEFCEELNDQVNKLNADVGAVRTTLLAALDVLEAHGLMADS